MVSSDSGAAKLVCIVFIMGHLNFSRDSKWGDKHEKLSYANRRSGTDEAVPN